MIFDDAIKLFRRYLETEKIRSKETVRAYMADLEDFRVYLESLSGAEGLTNVRTIDRFHTRGFLASRFGKIKKVSVGRKLAAIRTFFRFLVREGAVEANPAAGLRSPKCEKPLPKALSVDETERFFTRTGDRGKRDLAMFELLYSSGLRVGELTSLDVHDVDLSSGWVRVIGKGNKERYVPVGAKAVQALKEYLPLRELLAANNPATGKERPLFLNARGARLSSRQCSAYTQGVSPRGKSGERCVAARVSSFVCDSSAPERGRSEIDTRASRPREPFHDPALYQGRPGATHGSVPIDLTPEAEVSRRAKMFPIRDEGIVPRAHEILATLPQDGLKPLQSVPERPCKGPPPNDD